MDKFLETAVVENDNHAPAAVNHEEANDSSTVNPNDPQLPEELIFDILTYLMALPNGIHSDRFPSIKQARVDNMLEVNTAFARMASEALYKTNRLIIKPKTPKTANARWQKQGLDISYPKPDVNHWVRELEFHVYPHSSMTSTELCDLEHNDLTVYQKKQIQWLKKLASGELGFENLRSLRFVFVHKTCFTTRGQAVPSFLNMLRTHGALEFRASNVEVVVNTIIYDGTDDGRSEYFQSALAALLKAK